jgi:hypothetical protein
MATAQLVRNTDPRKGSGAVYNIKGLRGNIYFPESVFAGKEPDTIQVDIPEGYDFVTPGTQKASVKTMSPEERKAAQQKAAAERKAETPTQKAERARVVAEKAAKRAAKLAEEAAKLASAPVA